MVLVPLVSRGIPCLNQGRNHCVFQSDFFGHSFIGKVHSACGAVPVLDISFFLVSGCDSFHVLRQNIKGKDQLSRIHTVCLRHPDSQIVAKTRSVRRRDAVFILCAVGSCAVIAIKKLCHIIVGSDRKAGLIISYRGSPRNIPVGIHFNTGNCHQGFYIFRFLTGRQHHFDFAVEHIRGDLRTVQQTQNRWSVRQTAGQNHKKYRFSRRCGRCRSDPGFFSHREEGHIVQMDKIVLCERGLV